MRRYREAVKLGILLGFVVGLWLGWLRPRHQSPADSFSRHVAGRWGTQPTGTPWSGTGRWN